MLGDGPTSAVVVGGLVLVVSLHRAGDRRAVRRAVLRVRIPIFTGMAVCLLALAVVTWSRLALVGAALLVVGVELQVRADEEPYLRTTLGRPYVDYLGRTGRFVPRLRLG